MPDFLLPDLGEGLTEAEVVAWHVAVGDHVSVDQVVAEVETAKAVVDVPVPFAGVVSALHVLPGTPVRVGSPLLSVATADDVAERPAPPSAESGVAERPAPSTSGSGFTEPGIVVPDGASSGTEESSGSVLIGYGTSASRRRRRPGARRPMPASAAAADTRASAHGGPVRVISPVVRKLARDAGVDLHSLHGTGPGGLIRRADVEQAIAALTNSPQVEVTAQEPAERHEDGTRIPLRGLRRTVADKLSRSRREIPEATVWVDVDATELLAARALLNARAPERPVSLLALLARFTVLALRRYPELNARVEEDEIVVLDRVHLGFAAQTERGLVVPVVRGAHTLSTRDLSAALEQRTADARAGALAPADLIGGTITVNNYGVFGVDGSAAIINHPEVAIVGMGRIIDRPWVVDGQLAVRKVTQLTLAFDHRVCDGGTAGGFLRYVADCVESPLLALGDL
jgi:2-oxoisovalerate dehydrogenase E2 component (dihydrolipoyl transacylase)